ncbi:class I SAM-dependent methyltransferase [Sphingomonas floccifaciens]|uniref:Class I SAM-dependent methyltransferase n=1 Tax=Sphingomonas floccifaciens TaxID=1844115 RepID=A0ABW4NGD9_9SPHN
MTASHDWTGRVGDVWAAEWQRTDRSLADLSRHLDVAIEVAAPAGPFRALDIGCGAGVTSLALATARPDARIVGVDLSDALVAIARNRLTPAVLPRRREPRAASDELNDSGLPPSWEYRAEGYDGEDARVRFLTGDALDMAKAQAPFDLLYSRHGVMFFDDPVAAFATLRGAVRPGARLVFSCFRDWRENGFAAAPAAALGLPAPTPGPGPFAFADRAQVAAILSAAGWRDAIARPIDFTYRAGAGADPVGDALGFLQRIGPAASALRMRSDAERAVLVERLRAVIERYRSGNTVDFPAAAWIWSASA